MLQASTSISSQLYLKTLACINAHKQVLQLWKLRGIVNDQVYAYNSACAWSELPPIGIIPCRVLFIQVYGCIVFIRSCTCTTFVWYLQYMRCDAMHHLAIYTVELTYRSYVLFLCVVYTGTVQQNYNHSAQYI